MRKKSKRRMLGVLLSILACISVACGQSNDDMYQSVIDALSADEYYALVDIGATHPVLLTTTQVYDDGNDHQAAMDCDVYYPVGEQVQLIGTAESFGTAYPIAYSNDGLYTAGGHVVQHYFIEETDDAINWHKDVFSEDFTEPVEGTYYVNGEPVQTVALDEEDLDIYDIYVQAEVVDFTKK